MQNPQVLHNDSFLQFVYILHEGRSGLGSKLYLSNALSMLNKNLTRFLSTKHMYRKKRLCLLGDILLEIAKENNIFMKLLLTRILSLLSSTGC